ncbi:hypothetical protein [Dietzia massiliensis]|uniref:hypothetical protein n=1 Tax=Dietzia massiliensis TaxID=2697499 RepID=UPI001BD066EC|nr:hypothetical protein [Dietzia massiliensis]MBS7548843.1 hypothetical protein [Dietzia massiliensis]
MDRVYGNRLPTAYRWGVTALAMVPLVALVAGALAGQVALVPAFVLFALGAAAVAVYWAGGTTISADDGTVRIALFPLWRRRIPAEQIRSVHVEAVTPIGREWGNRGSLRRDGEIFIDAGHSSTCVAFHLHDGRVIRVGVESPEWGAWIVESLARAAGS